MNKNVSSSIPEDIYEKLENKTKEMDINKSKYIKQLIITDLNKETVVIKSSLLDKLKEKFNTEKVIINPQTSINPIKRNISWKYKLWEPTETFKHSITIHQTFRTKWDKIQYQLNGHWYDLKLNMHDLLVIDEVFREENCFYNWQINELIEILPFSGITVKSHAYVYMVGVYDEIIANFKSNMNNIDFSLLNNYLYLNHEKSTISVNCAKELIDIVNMKGFSELLVHGLIKSYPNNDSLEIRVICENYNNPDLLSLLRNKSKIDVINNPSKRRNLIKNLGGHLVPFNINGGFIYEC